MAEIVIVADAEAAGDLAADAVLRRLSRATTPTWGVATGSTPLSTYRAMAARDHDLSGVRAFALDEYVGLPAGHPESYRAVLDRELVHPLGLNTEKVHVPDGSHEGLESAGDRYEREIADAGGIEVQILGIGTDGHVGFNEPGSSLASRTRVKTLTEQTRQDNARFFDSPDDVPRHCVTQGLGTISRARHLILLAFGEGKAAAIAAAVEGPVTAAVPGSIIQLHPSVTVFVDEAAASRLAHADYYRHAYENKPRWQVL